jgi:hypothetical protein
MTKDNGGLAFPSEQGFDLEGKWNQTYDPGMSLRDYFAGQALAGILAGGFADTIPHDDVGGGSDAAFYAYQYADAMIAERNK